MKNLLIVESPAKCNKILSFLNDNYLCEATYGHLREINSLKQIDDNYNICFTPIPGKQKQINKLQKIIKTGAHVILATDDDREGEAIAWHVLDLFKLPLDTPRIKFNSITKENIVYAINHPTTVDMNLVNSQHTRQILDLSVGFKISPILWSDISRKNNLSAGRCQSPALSIIYDNHIKHQQTEEQIHYQLSGLFTNHNIPFKFNKTFEHKNDVLSILNTIKTILQFELSHQKKENLVKNPPLPFITSSLQQACSNSFNMAPKECMSICQTLYESGHITYMRTDSYFLSDDFRNMCYATIQNDYGEKYIQSEYVCKKKQGSQEAHEAIRPTQIATIPTLQGKYKKVYDMIYFKAIQSLMAPAIYDKHIFEARVNDTKTDCFKYDEEEIRFKGWTVLNKESNTNTFVNYLSNIQRVMAKKIVAEPHHTNTHHHFTEAKLIQELESRGIGRPSTYASIVEKIKERKYVVKQNIEGKKQRLEQFEIREGKIYKKHTEKTVGNEKNKLVIQPLGIRVIELLNSQFLDIFNYTFTGEMEQALDKIAENQGNKSATCQTYIQAIDRMLEEYKKSEKKQFKIDEFHEFVFSKNGPVIVCRKDDETTFKSVIDNIDYEKLKNNEYSLNELLSTDKNGERNLGTHKDKPVILKNGKYGHYICYDNRNISLRNVDKEFTDISLVDVIDCLDNNRENTSIVRTITNEILIKKGKYGDYIHYKTKNMTRPKFINLKKFQGDYINCSKDEVIKFTQQS